MKNRIERILKEEQMASSRFADEIGIQRPSMSHILTGRNKPSLDIIQRILRKFPHINSDWLILGVGDMYEKSHKGLSLFVSSDETKDDNLLNNTKPEIDETEKEFIEHENTSFIHSEKPVDVIKNRKIKRIMVFYDDGSFEEVGN